MEDVPLRSVLDEGRQCLLTRLREREGEGVGGGISVSTANHALDLFLAEANALAFERVLAHMCSYRDMVRRHLFAPRLRVMALRTDMVDALSDIHEAARAAGANAEEVQAAEHVADGGEGGNNDDIIVVPEEGDVEGAAAVAHLHAQRQLRCIDDALRHLIDEMEHGFERVRARLEDRLLEDPSVSSSTSSESRGRSGDSSDEEYSSGGGGGATLTDRLLTDRAVRRIISTAAFRTHNRAYATATAPGATRPPQHARLSSASPSARAPRRITTTPSEELRRVAHMRFDRLRIECAGLPGGQKLSALSRFLHDLESLVEDDYRRNRYNPDVRDVREFRAARLVAFVDG